MSMCQTLVTVLRIFSLSNLSNAKADASEAPDSTLAATTLRSLESSCIAACGFDISKRTIVKDMSPIFPNQKLRCS